MKFVFKNRELRKWVHEMFDESDVQRQIALQWRSDYPAIGIDSGVATPKAPFENVCMSLSISKKELFLLEYQPDRWNPWPQVTPPEGGKYLVTVRLLNGEVRTETDTYGPAFDSWETNGPQDVLAFRALPSPYEPKED